MIISAPILEQWDRCRRLWRYNVDWMPVRVTPLGAVYSALHAHVTADPYQEPSHAREHVMQLAADRGVETERVDPYDVMVHYAHLAEVLSRVVRQPDTAPLARYKPAGNWRCEAYLSDGGTRLVRFVLVDHWSDDRLMSELHSWRTVGDICVTGLPMTIRILVIGASRQGRRHGHWTKARLHPVNKQIRFARKHGKEDGLAASWGTVWREDSQVGPDAWIEQMARDGVLREVAFSQMVSVPGQYQRGKVLEDILRIGEEMVPALAGKNKFPMNRSACDMVGVGPCRYSCCCLGATEMEPGETGMFWERKRGE